MDALLHKGTQKELSRDEAYRAAVEEALAAMKHGMAYVGTALTFEFTMATVIFALVALAVKDASDPVAALGAMPRLFKVVGAFLIAATILVPMLAQFLVCRATRRHDIARRVQTLLFERSFISHLREMPKTFELAASGLESCGFAHYVLALCAALGIVGLAAWLQCVCTGSPQNLWAAYVLYLLLFLLGGWAVWLQSMAFRRSVTRHRINDFAEEVEGPRWLAG